MAFLTAALASGFSAAVLTTVVVWVVSVVTGSAGPWTAAPWLIVATTTIITATTYLAEVLAYGRTMLRQRSLGEPWAFRD
ncbi:MAG: hypothetical protein ABIW50_02740 [Candidatus Limnocylindria bacterium]